jgi:hypothetical protein
LILYSFDLLISEAIEISEKLDPDDDGMVTLTELRDFFKAKNVNGSLSKAQFWLEEASERGKCF